MNWNEWHALEEGDTVILDGASLLIHDVKRIIAEYTGSELVHTISDVESNSIGWSKMYDAELPRMTVSVEDNRPFPIYKNTPIMTLTRNTLNEAGWDWKECIELVARIQEVILDADYLMDDYGHLWVRVSVDK